MVSGILAAIGFSAGVLFDKFELSQRHMRIRHFIPVLFLLLALFSGLITLIMPGEYIHAGHHITLNVVVAFVVMIILAVAWNIFYYRALVKETVQEFDLILLTEPLITIALAGVFFTQERNSLILLAALVASIALIFAHMHHRKVRFNHYAQELLLAIMLMAFEVLLTRILLQTFSPFFLYFVRTTIISVVLIGIYRPQWSKIHLGDIGVVAISASFGVLQMLARYVGYQNGGIILTTLMLLLGPVLVEAASVILLKEKLPIRSGLAFVVILLCVMYASIYGLSL